MGSRSYIISALLGRYLISPAKGDLVSSLECGNRVEQIRIIRDGCSQTSSLKSPGHEASGDIGKPALLHAS
jgi:hypothetical protein